MKTAPSWKRVPSAADYLIVGATSVVVAAAIVLLLAFTGIPASFALMLLPITLAGWRLGRAAVAIYVVTFALLSYLFVAMTDYIEGSPSFLLIGNLVSLVVFLALGLAGALVGDTVRKTRRQNDRIRDLASELERSNKELEQFAYVASHDLQEPLRMVTSYLGLIEKRNRETLDRDTREFMDFAVDGAKRMQRMIQDLLTYSRVGTEKAACAAVDLNGVYDKSVTNLSVAVQTAGAAVTRDTLPTVNGIESQLVRLFQNLIGNAIKFGGEKTPEIHIHAGRDRDMWTIGVRDNGIGIPADQHDRVFQIFQRLHTHEEYEGTGIGLAVCQKTVERHGGKIWVESEVGVGTTFWFSLPAATEA